VSNERNGREETSLNAEREEKRMSAGGHNEIGTRWRRGRATNLTWNQEKGEKDFISAERGPYQTSSPSWRREGRGRGRKVLVSLRQGRREENEGGGCQSFANWTTAIARRSHSATVKIIRRARGERREEGEVLFVDRYEREGKERRKVNE